MNKLSSGVDLIEITRFQEAVDRHGERLLLRIFTPLELKEAKGKTASLAARFAAKEAVSKALGCGIGIVGWREIEIRRGPDRQPQLHLYGAAAQIAARLGLAQWSISLSHSQHYAIALAVGFGS
jgi:holo-[acyl-carrier protein] synthase